MRKILVTLLMMVVLSCTPLCVRAAETSLDDFAYTPDEAAGTVLLEGYRGTARSVTVAGSYWVDGQLCRTVLDASSVFRGNGAITSVTLLEGVMFSEDSMGYLFADCSALTQVSLAEGVGQGVVDMSYLFYNCTALTALDLSGLRTERVTALDGMFCNCTALRELTGYENWDTGAAASMYMMFSRTSALDRVDLRGWDLDQVENTGWCFQACGASEILLPENLAVISAGFFNHAAAWSGTVFTVPAGVRRIGYGHTFYDFGTAAFTAFAVSPENPYFKAVDGVLYSADGTELLAVPRGKVFAQGVFEIPEGVTFLGELSFSRNPTVRTLLLPNSLEVIQYVPPNDRRYILYEDTGNLNGGNSLSIALYRFVSVTQYAVKEDNPRYRSVDGILYTKAMDQVVAIPTCYDRDVIIPEGVTDWNREAMWNTGTQWVDALMTGSAVCIPASLTRIAEDQLEKLNRLAGMGFRLTVAEENPAYRVDETGALVEKPQLSQAQITLEPEVFVYDGTAHTPAPTVRLGGGTLIPGTDYALTYENNQNAGEASLTLTGLGIYGGTVRLTFRIERAPAPAVTAPEGCVGIYGQTLSRVELPAGFSWVDDSQSLGEAGVKQFAAVYTCGDPNYEPSRDIPVTVTVRAKELTPEVRGLDARYPYTGDGVLPQLQLLDGEALIPETEYTLEFSDNIQPGTATVTVCDVPGGNYTLSGSYTFTITAPEKTPSYWLALPIVLLPVTVTVLLYRRHKKKK